MTKKRFLEKKPLYGFKKVIFEFQLQCFGASTVHDSLCDDCYIIPMANIIVSTNEFTLTYTCPLCYYAKAYVKRVKIVSKNHCIVVEPVITGVY